MTPEAAKRSLSIGRRRLAIASLAIALIWCIALPWLAQLPAQQAAADRLEAQGINPAAMYYTELEMMDGVLDRLERGNP
jgi:hypothetical protein